MRISPRLNELIRYWLCSSQVFTSSTHSEGGRVNLLLSVILSSFLLTYPLFFFLVVDGIQLPLKLDEETILTSGPLLVQTNHMRSKHLLQEMTEYELPGQRRKLFTCTFRSFTVCSSSTRIAILISQSQPKRSQWMNKAALPHESFEIHEDVITNAHQGLVDNKNLD